MNIAESSDPSNSLLETKKKVGGRGHEYRLVGTAVLLANKGIGTFILYFEVRSQCTTCTPYSCAGST